MSDEPEPITALPESRDLLVGYLEYRSQESSENKRHAIVPHVYHASEGGYCTRQLYYKHTGLPTETDKPLGIFIMGELVETVMTDAYKWFYGAENIRKVPVFIRIDDKFDVTGSTDIIVCNDAGLPLLQAEVKSNARGANAKSSYHQLVQAATYGKLVAIPENRVIHPSRNDPTNMPEKDRRMSAEEVERYYNQAIDNFRRLDAALETKTLPPAKPPKSSQCEYCPYQKQCQADGGWGKGPRGGLKPPLPMYGDANDE